ncbi:hypothetical protein L593_01955 [Salinarchaeum sp. Harcht-Bsk1]|nr:hypothetical protein L593_01955 [Salinarchaeum sp. Harcht-Bsk1]
MADLWGRDEPRRGDDDHAELLAELDSHDLRLSLDVAVHVAEDADFETVVYDGAASFGFVPLHRRARSASSLFGFLSVSVRGVASSAFGFVSIQTPSTVLRKAITSSWAAETASAIASGASSSR